MGKTSGGVRDGMLQGDSSYNGDVKNVESLVHMKDKAFYKATKEAISRFHSVLGVRQKNVKLADMDEGAPGVHFTKNGQSEGVYLNKYYYNGTKGEMEKMLKGLYKKGMQTETNKPIAHVVTHELAHATWNSRLSAPNAKAASGDINKLYKQWKKDKTKKGYGKYAETNVDEFFAETATKAIHGKADKYTTKIKSIVKKYKL